MRATAVAFLAAKERKENQTYKAEHHLTIWVMLLLSFKNYFLM